MTRMEYLVNLQSCLEKNLLEAELEKDQIAIYKKLMEVNDRIFNA